jgi:DNA-binding transcriptional LysR family regulator
MDIDLARTFIDIFRTGSFIATAERLHVTQTTVTARIQNLEAQLDCKLFIRNRAGAKPTEYGERFMPYASQLVQTWDAARRDLPLAQGLDAIIAIGGEISLGSPLMLKWAVELRNAHPAQTIRVVVADGSALQEKIELGLLTAALVYRPEYRPGIQVEQILEEKLIQVASVSDPEPYFYVDWGPDFRKQHNIAMPEKTKPALSFNLGPLALQYMLQCGGSGFFRTRVVQEYIEKKLLTVVQYAPEFSYPVYLVYSRTNKLAALDQALAVLRRLAKDQSDWSQRWDRSI